MDTLPPEVTRRSFFHSHRVLYIVFALCLVFIFGYNALSAPTNNQSIANRQPVIIHIGEGQSLGAVTADLEAKHIVKYGSLLKVFLRIFALDRQIERGDYKFDHGMSLPRVAWMLARGDHRLPRVKITFKEGITNEEMVTILSAELPSFRKDLFLSDERARQGYLFPDTYFFFSLTTSSEIVSDISHNFTKHIASLEADIAASHHTFHENIVMASILEKEAKGKDDANVIAGILWKRIAQGMVLQVDAAKETYRTTGLPREAIANPGIISIDAAIHPTESPYLYYLHGKDGKVHYGVTFAEHKKNIVTYLK